MKRKIELIIGLILLTLPTVAPLNFTLDPTSQSTTRIETNSISQFDYEWQNQSNWHIEEDNITTSEVAVEFSQEISSEHNCCYQWTRFKYYASRRSSFTPEVAFRFTCTFKNGTGLDFENKIVEDWSELDQIIPVITTDDPIPTEANLGEFSHSERKLRGFKIYNGTGNDLNFTKQNFPSFNYWEIKPEKEPIGLINFENSPIRIGTITLDTEPYISLNGEAKTKSIANFDVQINATMGTTSNNHTIPAMLNFEINHTVDYTKYKYGVSINWSNIKDFPTDIVLNSGDPYCLISDDELQMAYYDPDLSINSLYQFEANENNDTIFFKQNDFTLSQNTFTTNYIIKNKTSSKDIETKRKYYQAGLNNSDGELHSKLLVIFDGFKYNQSTSLHFDPTFTVFSGSDGNNGENGDSPFSPWIIVIISTICISAVLIGIGSWLLFKRRRNNLKI